MLKNGCIINSSIVSHNGYIYFIGGTKNTPNGEYCSRYITRVSIDDFISYFEHNEELNDEIIAEFDKDITLTSAICHDKYIFIIGGALSNIASDSDYVYNIDSHSLNKLKYKHPGEPCLMNLHKIIHGDDAYIYSFSGFNYCHDNDIYYTKIIGSELSSWNKGLSKFKYIKGSIVHYNSKTHVFEIYGGKDPFNRVVDLYRETTEPFIKAFHTDVLELGPIASSYYHPYRDGFIIAGGNISRCKRTNIIYYIKRNEYTGENEYIHIGNINQPLSDINALLIEDTLYVLSGYNDKGVTIENIHKVKLNI